jgi:hypothetical protein
MVLSLLMIILISLGCSFYKINMNSRGAKKILKNDNMNLIPK